MTESNGERQMLTLKRQPDRVIIRATATSHPQILSSSFGFTIGWICSSISIPQLYNLYNPSNIFARTLTVFLELRSLKTVHFSDKYPSILSRQMKAIVYIQSSVLSAASQDSIYCIYGPPANQLNELIASTINIAFV